MQQTQTDLFLRVRLTLTKNGQKTNNNKRFCVIIRNFKLQTLKKLKISLYIHIQILSIMIIFSHGIDMNRF